jgi:hypothetical protein
MKAKSGRQLSYAIGFPYGVTLADVAAGKHDSHYVTAANTLAQYGMLGVELRFGVEMDGAWFPWEASPGSGKEANFAAAFRRVVTVMRQAQPTNKWVWVWNPTMHRFTDRAYLERLWPGDDVVDQIGIDCYDQTDGAYYPSGSNRLARQQAVWATMERRLNILAQMGRDHRKPLQFPEWGLVVWEGEYAAAGGGDNPYFIQKMHEFFTNPANNVAMHSYFDVGGPGSGLYSGLDNFPQSKAKFKELFGAGASQ